MSSIAATRVKREIQSIKSSGTNDAALSLELVDDNLEHLRGTIAGPEGTPYEGGIFELNIQIPQQYPFQPPKVDFITKLWHPNVSSVTGAICLDILRDQWAAALTLRTVLLSITALLAAPEPDDPQDAVVARQYKSDNALFLRVAKFWSCKYANAKQTDITADMTETLKSVCNMGFSEQQSTVALSQNNWNAQEAAAYLTDQ